MHLVKFTKVLLFIFIVFTLTGCGVPRYTICTSDDFPLEIVKGCRLIILNEEIMNRNRPLFEKTIQLLDSQEYDELELFLENGNDSSNDLEFCKALMSFHQGHYETALTHLDNVTDFEYKCLVKLLKADVEYETKLSEGFISPNQPWGQVDPHERVTNRSQLLKKYQDVYDCDSSEENHSMVKMRVKQLKYAR